MRHSPYKISIRGRILYLYVGQQPFPICNLYGYSIAEYSRFTSLVVCDEEDTCQAEGYYWVGVTCLHRRERGALTLAVALRPSPACLVQKLDGHPILFSNETWKLCVFASTYHC